MSNDRFQIELQLDAVAGEFEQQWQSAQARQIEECLAAHPDLPGAELLQHLIRSDVELRRAQFIEVRAEEYLRRFPEQAVAVRRTLISLGLWGADESSAGGIDLLSLAAPCAIAPAGAGDPVIARGTAFGPGGEPMGGPAAEGGDPSGAVDAAERTRQGSAADTRVAPGDSSGPSEAAPPVGDRNYQRVGRYLLLREIGRGGMATVFEALDTSLQRTVALKVIRSDGSSRRMELQRFENEARAAAAVRHPNVVTIYDYGSEDDCRFIAMERIHGETLKTMLTARRVELDVLVGWMIRVASGLQAIHDRGLVHRDIKPHNILIRGDGQPVVVDLGLVKTADDRQLTMTGDLLGTPAYTSPEQARFRGAVGPAADIHGMGVVLYEMATGQLPFSGQDVHQTLHRIAHDAPLSPRSRELNPDLSRDLETIILKCLEKEPTGRYSTAAALADDLQRYLDGKPIAAQPASVPVRLARWVRRRPQTAMMIGLLVVASVASLFAAAMFLRSSQAEARYSRSVVKERDEAVAAGERERILREEADAARRDAEDAARFAESQQVRAACQAAQVALDAGRTGAETIQLLTPIRLMFPASHSLEGAWLEHLASSELIPGSHFSTSDWGLFDAQVSADGRTLATVDRTGRVDLWEIASGKRIRALQPTLAFSGVRPIPRWGVIARRYPLDAPVDPASYPVSLTWLGSDRLLVAGLDGSIRQYGVAGEPVADWHRLDRPVHLVRATPDQQVLVVDDEGTLLLLDRSGQELARGEAGSAVQVLRFDADGDCWIVGSAAGKILLLGRGLERLAETEVVGPLHDVRGVAPLEDGIRRLLAVSGEGPVQEFRVERNGDAYRIEESTAADIPDRPGRMELRQAAALEGNQLIALDDRGNWHQWRDGRYWLSVPVGLVAEIRIPRPDEMPLLDAIEARNRIHLIELPDGWLQVSMIGTVKKFDRAAAEKKQPWRRLTSQVGSHPQVQPDPHRPGHFWALAREGQLCLVDCVADRIVAKEEQAHRGGREDLVVLRNGELMTVGNDPAIRCWRLQENRIVEFRRFEAPDPLVSLAVHEDRGLAAAVDNKAVLHLFELQTGRILHSYRILPDSSANPFNPETGELLIHTGRVAFSRSGKYVGAFGALQCFAVLETGTFQPCRMSDTRIAGDGGTAICFSPVSERRFFHSSPVGSSCNAVVPTDPGEDRRFQLSYAGAECLDLAPTPDGRRLVGLMSDDEIHFLAGEHLHQVYRMPAPLESSHSLAIGPDNESLLVADESGGLAYGTIGTQRGAPVNLLRRAGRVQAVVRPEGPGIFLAPPGFGSDLVRDEAGNLVLPLIRGSNGDQAPDRRGGLLRKRSGEWRFEPLRFGSEEEGPCLDLSLARAPDGRLWVVLRQGNPDLVYDGRVLLAREEEDGGWSTSIVHPKGNRGHTPWLRFDASGKPVELQHFDYESARFCSSRPGADGQEWDLQTHRFFCGYRRDVAEGPDGTTHFLLTGMHGMGSDTPQVYGSRQQEPGAMIRFEEHWNVPVGDLLVNSRGQVLVWNGQRGILYERVGAGEWQERTRYPGKQPAGQTPWIDERDRIWVAECAGRQLDCYCYDGEVWRKLELETDQEFSAGLNCCGSFHPDGRLQVLVYRAGLAWELKIVESADPLAGDW